MGAHNRPFATVDDYEARYGPCDDRDRLSEILMDASLVIEAELAAAGKTPDGCDPDMLRQACRSMAERAVSAASTGAPAGVTQFSQGAIGITESWSLANPNAEVYMTKTERRLLGIAGGRAGFAGTAR